MKLSKLYTNDDAIFPPIFFRDGVNVVLAEIRIPDNLNKDTHNLGKTTLCKLIDFCLLSEPKGSFFLFQHYCLFEHFIFFLEIEIAPSHYVTIRRSVALKNKIAFKVHRTKNQNYSKLNKGKWDHWEAPIRHAKQLLDGMLNLTALTPWPYRKGLPYVLRGQGDYRDEFQPETALGKDIDWMPFLLHLMGFNYRQPVENYKIKEEITQTENDKRKMRFEMGSLSTDGDEIDGLVEIKERDIERIKEELDSFDFNVIDKK
jgi:Uncharacterized protein conserved in bacteria